MPKLNAIRAPKVEPFVVNLPRPLAAEEIEKVLATAVSRSSLPDREKPKNLDFEIPLTGIFQVAPAEDGSATVMCTPDPEAVDDAAVRWCQALTKIPPKSLPRSQRPITKLLLRLPPKPTGNPAFDKARRMILDQTLATLWPSLAGVLTDALVTEASRPA